MAYIELPILPDTPDQSFSIALDESVYHVRLRYNTRADFWMLFISTADGAPLLSGIAIRLGVDILTQYADAQLPPGALFAVNFVDAYADPDRDNFGRDVSLIYLEAE